MIPLLHDFTDQTVLVVGGGSVGARKARRFAREATVVVLSPRFDADLLTNRFETPGPKESNSDDAQNIHCVRAAPAPDDAEDWITRINPALVVVATDDETINDAFVVAAQDADVLVNRADHSGGRDPTSVVVPATVDDDPVTIAIATGGSSPALSKYLREHLESEFESDLDGAGKMASLTATLRSDLKAAGVAPETRRDAVRAVVRSAAVWKALRSASANPRKMADDVISRVVDTSEWST